jgi:hypothetical protein
MKVDRCITIGSNCDATHIGRGVLGICKECFLFDWALSHPRSVAGVLRSLRVDGLSKTFEKLAKFEGPDGYCKNFDMCFPHCDDKMKIARRLRRLEKAITDESIFILFLYCDPCNVDEHRSYNGMHPTKYPEDGFVELVEEILKVRKFDTFRIAWIGIEERSLSIPNIDYYKVEEAPNSRFWIPIAANAIKSIYTLA